LAQLNRIKETKQILVHSMVLLREMVDTNKGGGGSEGCPVLPQPVPGHP